jgi:hypothetical protein
MCIFTTVVTEVVKTALYKNKPTIAKIIFMTIPNSHFSYLVCHPGLHPKVSVQTTNSQPQESDKHPSHDSL